MSVLMEKDLEIEEIINSQEIHARIAEVAETLNEKYASKELYILMIMKGAICLTADLIRHLTISTEIDYVRCVSYRSGMTSGALELIGNDSLELKDKHVLIVDDIFDTGKTLDAVVNHVSSFEPASVETLVLLDKKVKKITNYRPDYSLFRVEDLFVIGYGLDYDEKYRGLPGVCIFKNPPC